MFACAALHVFHKTNDVAIAMETYSLDSWLCLFVPRSSTYFKSSNLIAPLLSVPVRMLWRGMQPLIFHYPLQCYTGCLRQTFFLPRVAVLVAVQLVSSHATRFAYLVVRSLYMLPAENHSLIARLRNFLL